MKLENLFDDELEMEMNIDEETKETLERLIDMTLEQKALELLTMMLDRKQHVIELRTANQVCFFRAEVVDQRK